MESKSSPHACSSLDELHDDALSSVLAFESVVDLCRHAVTSTTFAAGIKATCMRRTRVCVPDNRTIRTRWVNRGEQKPFVTTVK